MYWLERFFLLARRDERVVFLNTRAMSNNARRKDILARREAQNEAISSLLLLIVY